MAGWGLHPLAVPGKGWAGGPGIGALRAPSPDQGFLLMLAQVLLQRGGSPRGRPACLQDKPPGRHRPLWSWAMLGAGGWQSLAVGLGMVHAAGEPWGCGPWHGGEGVQASGTRDPGVPLAPCSQPCPGMPGYRGAGDWNWLLQLKWRHRWRPAHSAAWRNAWRS